MSGSAGHERRSADASVAPELGIGPRLTSYRTRRGIKVSALARAVGVSASLISQIERGQSRPSVSTLLALAEALDVPMDAFFRDADDGGGANGAGYGSYDGDGDDRRRPAMHAPMAHEESSEGAAAAPMAHEESSEGAAAAPARANRHLVRRAERAAIAIEGGVRWERLTPTQLAEVEFMELVYSPGAESHASRYRHPGMEMVVMLEGRMDIYVAFERYELGPGDSLCFPSTTPHRYVNPTDDTARAVTVILPDAGGPGVGGAA